VFAGKTESTPAPAGRQKDGTRAGSEKKGGEGNWNVYKLKGKGLCFSGGMDTGLGKNSDIYTY